MIKRNYWLISFSYLLLVTGLFFYSFTQIDLNLTLSQATIFQSFQKFFIQIGYFNRPLSTAIFLILTFLFFIFYFLFLCLVAKKKITERQVWLLTIASAVILLFSYPAFSHDIFNYMFWAKIFTHYGLSPYQYKALDFPADPWIRFMHWTHATYNHGPVFLLFSFLPSWLGLDKFLLTLFNFKLLNVAAFLGSAYMIGKIVEKINPSAKLLALAFFVFNLLVIIESLVSGHNDILMLFFALISIYFLIDRKHILAFLFLLLSAGIKFVTSSFLPFYLLVIFRQKVNWQLVFKTLIVVFLISLVPVIIQREPYPWYFISVVGMVSLVVASKFVFIVTIGMSLGLLLRYAPFLYFGDYKPPVPTFTFWLTVIPVVISVLIWIGRRLYSFKGLKKNHEG